MRRGLGPLFILTFVLCGLSWTSGYAADKVLTITMTAPMTTDNPYGDSSAPIYSVWCHTYGCLARYDFAQKKLVGVLAEKWEAVDPTTWRFTLRRNLKRQDGGPGPTSADVIHSLDRIRTDPESVQSSFIAEVKNITSVDDYTFDVHTKGPAVDLPMALADQFIITSADLYKQYGRDADKTHAFGWGPYQLQEYSLDRRIVIRKFSNSPETEPGSPDVVIYQQMRDADQRVTALLNNEVQVALTIPPQLIRRLENNKDVKILKTPSDEEMFVAFNDKMAPWTDVRLRRAVAYAINRKLIIDRLLGGFAEIQDGAIGPNQYCYTGPPDHEISYDPAKAKELLAEAGYKDGGPEIDFYTANGRYTSDVQIAEAVAQMLRQVGFKVNLHAPEYAVFWADVRKGKTPMYYMGRGGVFDASIAIGQLFVTGGSPRVQYSNPKLDDLMTQQYAAFDEQKRCALFRQINQIIVDDVPSFFMHSHTVVTGLRANVKLNVEPSGEYWLPDARME